MAVDEVSNHAVPISSVDVYLICCGASAIWLENLQLAVLRNLDDQHHQWRLSRQRPDDLSRRWATYLSTQFNDSTHVSVTEPDLTHAFNFLCVV